METIEATYHITTPMFIGGGTPEQDAEIRIPSFKGALRFWWRALAWARLKGELTKIKQEEEQIFGSTERQSRILMTLCDQKLASKKKKDSHPKLKDSPGLLYLGYGVCESYKKKGTEKGQLIRSCIDENQEFTVKMYFKNTEKDDHVSSVIKALKVLGLLGGMGSKSRKGYGSVTLKLLKRNNAIEYQCPTNKEALVATIQDLLPPEELPQSRPRYTAFSQQTRIELVDEGSNAMELLNRVGETLQLYRSWGSKGKVNTSKAEQNFPEDHDLAKDVSEDKPVAHHPKRIVFGLPHNYYFSSTRKKTEFNPHLEQHVEINRRASPLLIHVHAYKKNQYAVLVAVMPADFLPVKAKIEAHKNRIDCNIDFSVLESFLDGCKGPRDHKTKERYFPDKVSIL